MTAIAAPARRVLLVNLPEPASPVQKPTCIPPVGLWSIRTYLREAGVDCDVLDKSLSGGHFLIALESIPEAFDVVGLSARFSVQHQAYESWAALTENATIVAGGAHAAAVPAPFGVSKVAQGSGEAFFKDLLKLEAPADFPWLPFPRFSTVELDAYLDVGRPHDLRSKTPRWYPLETSRGCGCACGYCGVTNFWGPWQGRSVRDVLKQLAYLDSEHGVQEVFIEDDQVARDIPRFVDLVRLLEDFGIWWSCPNGISTRALQLSVVQEALQRSTCWRLSLPFETGNLRSAGLMGIEQKFLPWEDANLLVRQLTDLGIETSGFFVIGYPGETADDVKRTLEYANSLPLGQRGIYMATPYPGTRLYEECLRNNWLTVMPPALFFELRYARAVISTPWLSADDLQSLRDEDRRAALERKPA